MSKELGVGIIGASADRGWAKDSHVPAVQGLEGLRLVAVAAGDEKKASAAAKTFGVDAGYGSGFDLIKDPAVDIVTIAVKVPDHRELVLAALSAGKHVYCEWPLGRNLYETEELAAAAKAVDVHACIGLQTRMNPALRLAREMVASGSIGRALAIRVFSNTVAFGSRVEKAMSFAEDPNNGVSLVTIQGAHTIDCAIALMGPLTDLAGQATTQFPQVSIAGSEDKQARSTADHLLVQARFRKDAAPLCVEVVGGRLPDEATFRMEVDGERGAIRIGGGAPRGFQSGRLAITVRDEPQAVEEGEVSAMTDAAANVASMYVALRDDIHSGSETVPNFEHAVRLATLIDDVLQSSWQGTRKVDVDWPA